MKHSRVYMALALLLALLAAAGCTRTPEVVDFSDPGSSGYVTSAADLEAFFASGESDSISLAASIDVGGSMLVLTKERGHVTISGNGYSITGTGDCVIRLDEGASITLDRVEIRGSVDGIGMMGGNTVGGVASTVSGALNGVSSVSGVTVAAGSSLTFMGSDGSGIDASALVLESAAKVSATGGMCGALIGSGGVELGSAAELSAFSGDYNALRCPYTVTMREGSVLTVTNTGEYHGAEIGRLVPLGNVTVYATGGAKGVGLFLLELDEELSLKGYCEPAARSESGDGSIEFIG